MVDEEEAAELITGSLAPVSVVERNEEVTVDEKTIWKIERSSPKKIPPGLSMTGNPVPYMNGFP